MYKLGFAIKTASGGIRETPVWNDGTWRNKIRDIREYCKLFDGLQDTKNTVTFISFDENGCFVTLLRTIPGRGNDFLSGWIYIPSVLNISGSNVIDACHFVKTILSQSNLYSSTNDIDSFFSKEYPQKEIPIIYTPSPRNQRFGVRYFVENELEEILGKNRHQSYYSMCEAIFLLNKNEEVGIKNEYVSSIKDFSNFDILKTIILTPPSSADLQNLFGQGTKLFTDEKVFSSPILVNPGNKEFVLKRNGFENRAFTYYITDEPENQKINFASVITQKWEKQITPSMFEIYSEDNLYQKIEEGLTIKVNDQHIPRQGIRLLEEECERAIIKITSNYYDPYEATINLLSRNILKITLTRKMKQLHEKVELSNGNIGKMTLESPYLDSRHESPLKGYDFDDEHGDRVLRLSWLFVWKQRLYGFLAALIIACLIWTYYEINAFFDSHEFIFGWPPIQQKTGSAPTTNTETAITERKAGSSSSSEANAIAIDPDAAVSYMNTHEKWVKAELEKYALTKGLFDQMNFYKFAEIASRDINGCHNFDEIKKIATEMKDFSSSSMSFCNNDNDTIITISKYLTKINSMKASKNEGQKKAQSKDNTPKENGKINSMKDEKTQLKDNTPKENGKINSMKDEKTQSKDNTPKENGKINSMKDEKTQSKDNTPKENKKNENSFIMGEPIKQ